MQQVNQLAKQMLDFQKSTFENTFNTINVFQEQSERMFDAFLDQQGSMMPQESKNAIKEWLNMCKKARDDYKKMVDDGFKKVDSYFSGESGSTSTKSESSSKGEKAKAS